MKVVNPNDKVLKFIQKTIIKSHLFDINNESQYNHKILLEEHELEWDGYMYLILECEKEFGIKISDLNTYKVTTPLELHSLIVEQLNKK